MRKVLVMFAALTVFAGVAVAYTETEARDKYATAADRRPDVVAARDATLTSYAAAEAAYTYQVKRFNDNKTYLSGVMPMMDYNMVQWHLYLSDQYGTTGDSTYATAMSYWARGDASHADAFEEMNDPLGTSWDAVYLSSQDANSEYLSAKFFFEEAGKDYADCITHSTYAYNIMNKYIP